MFLYQSHKDPESGYKRNICLINVSDTEGRACKIWQRAGIGNTKDI